MSREKPPLVTQPSTTRGGFSLGIPLIQPPQEIWALRGKLGREAPRGDGRKKRGTGRPNEAKREQKEGKRRGKESEKTKKKERKKKNTFKSIVRRFKYS